MAYLSICINVKDLAAYDVIKQIVTSITILERMIVTTEFLM